MTVKFMTVKGQGNLANTPFYVGFVQHERTMSRRETYDYCAERTGFKAAAIRVGAEQATFICNVGMDGTSVTLTRNPEFSIYAGEYENVALEYTVFRGMESETLTLTIPRLVVT